MLLTYDFSDLAEASAVRALAGESPSAAGCRSPFPACFRPGHGLTR